MATIAHSLDAGIDGVDVTAYKIPTATELESDGTLVWDATSLVVVEVHAEGRTETAVHLEYFFDHYRIEGMLFDGNLDPSQGRLTPDRSRPGLGLELKRDEAERYRIPTGGGS